MENTKRRSPACATIMLAGCEKLTAQVCRAQPNIHTLGTGVGVAGGLNVCITCTVCVRRVAFASGIPVGVGQFGRSGAALNVAQV